MNNLKLKFFLLGVSMIAALCGFSTGYVSLQDAEKNGWVKLIIKSKGGYTGDVIEMDVKNISAQRITLQLEVGRVLDSKNQDEQDILITQEQIFGLNADQTITVNA